MLEIEESKNSIHGDLIKVVAENWAKNYIFEPNNKKTREMLKFFLDKFLPNISTTVSWDKSPESVDNGILSGRINFINEIGVNSVIDFSIVPSGIIN